MIKRIINRSKDYLTLIPNVEQSWADQMKGKISCLLYHRIEEYGAYDFLDNGGSPVTSPADFNDELEYLKQLPTRFYTLENLNQGDFPDHNTIGIVICFDDGFKCNYEQGLTVLNKHQIPAVFFQCSSFIDSTQLIWEHLLYWLFSNPQTQGKTLEHFKKNLQSQIATQNLPVAFLREQINAVTIETALTALLDKFDIDHLLAQTAQDIYPVAKHIHQAVENGHEIASHGHHHYKRETIDDDLFEQELQISKTTLSDITGKEPVSFSYPFNSYKPQDHKTVGRYFTNIATVALERIHQPISEQSNVIPRFTWPGKSNSSSRMKRWLLTGSF